MEAIGIIFFLFFTYSNACKCVVVDYSKPDFLCKADYVLRGDVESETLIGNVSMPMTRYRLYTVKVQTIYKGMLKLSNITLGNTSYITIKTSEDSAACGITFPLNKDLIISGSLRGTEVHNFRCSGWHKEVTDLSPEFKKFLSDMQQHCESGPTSPSPTTTIPNSGSKCALYSSIAFGFVLLLNFITVHIGTY